MYQSYGTISQERYLRSTSARKALIRGRLADRGRQLATGSSVRLSVLGLPLKEEQQHQDRGPVHNYSNKSI